MRNPYNPTKATLESVTSETGNIKTFVLRPAEPLEFLAGQFVEVTVPGLGEAPFTPSSSPSRKDGLDVTVMRAGKVTSALHDLESGATLGVRGPYGKPYPLDQYAGKDVLIFGGGVGLAPLRSLLLALLTDRAKFGRIILCYGARTPADLIFKAQVRSWAGDGQMEVHLTVDRGDETWKGKVGVVTEALKDVNIDTARTVAAVCGPPLMMKFGTLALLHKGFPPEAIYLSMERNMSCGIGKCGHCRIGPYYVCKDGPVFTYAQLKGIKEIW